MKKLRRNQIVIWRGFKATIMEVFRDTVKIQITNTWKPIVQKNEVEPRLY